MKHFTRRPWLLVQAILVFSVLGTASQAPAQPLKANPTKPEVQSISFAVKETAGIRRYGYPVNLSLVLPQSTKASGHFRLTAGGRCIDAQFTPSDPRQASPTLGTDFDVSIGPNEFRQYLLQYGPEVSEGPFSTNGLIAEIAANEFRIIHAPYLQFAVPRNLVGLLNQVQTPKIAYLRPASLGLVYRDKNDKPHRAGGPASGARPVKASVTKQGPRAITLQFDGVEARGVRFKVEMAFPVSKSWVRVQWDVEDPQDVIASLGCDLNLKFETEPVLVDFGAGTYVYAHLKKDQRAILRGGIRHALGKDMSWWETRIGSKEKTEPYVIPGSSMPSVPAEGWAHVMDRHKCLAVAAADFGTTERGSEFIVDADGRLQIWQHFSGNDKSLVRGKKKLAFWLHFVDMPVQVGAVTSPQSMLQPLKIQIIPSPTKK